MPAGVFVAWSTTAARRTVAEQLRQTHAVALGAAGLVADKKGQRTITRALKDMAALAEG